MISIRHGYSCSIYRIRRRASAASSRAMALASARLLAAALSSRLRIAYSNLPHAAAVATKEVIGCVCGLRFCRKQPICPRRQTSMACEISSPRGEMKLRPYRRGRAGISSAGADGGEIVK